MKRLLLFLLSAICLSSCGGVASSGQPAQRILPGPEEQGYVPAFTSQQGGVLVNEFTKPGDSINDWERLVTRMHMQLPGQAEQIARFTASDLKRQCPHAKVEFHRLPGNAFSVEHSHNGCGKWEGHRSIRKVMNGRDGVYSIAFDMKNKAYVPAEYAEWKRRILASRLSD